MERFKYLFNHYVSNTATALERLEFQNLLQDTGYDQLLKELIDEYFSNYSINRETEIISGAEDILKAVLHSDQTATHKTTVKRLWPRIAVASAAAAAIILGVWFFSAPRHSEIVSVDHLANNIQPGTNKATLTLTNGKVINLSTAKSGVIVENDRLNYNDGTSILSVQQRPTTEDPSPSAQMTLSTPRGGTYQITLVDGTKVWLNAASSLTYSSTVNQLGQRHVKLEGEAYFEVAKDKKHPFIVESRGQTVEVLGTHFNINSYPDEQDIKTTLLEGSVKVRSTSNQTAILKPDQQAILSSMSLNVTPVDTEAFIAWKNGNFLFKGEPIEPIMRKLAYWYDIEVVYLGQKPNGRFRGLISRHNNISDVLKKMELTGAVHFKIEGRKVYVKE